MVKRYEVDPDNRFKSAVTKALTEVSDLSPAFMLIKRSWYKSNQAIFGLKGPGKYPPLGGLKPNDHPFFKKKDGSVTFMPYTNRQRAEASKRRRYGFDYPILLGTGRTMASLTGESADSIADYNETQLNLGSRVPYLFFHQAPGERHKLPFRPVIFLGAEQSAPDEVNNRQDAWIEIVQKFVTDTLAKNLGGVK